jgi:ATP adenylyltransferase
MQVLWAPWRMAYIVGPKDPGCIFCAAVQSEDLRGQLVLAQQPAVVMLNKFPYANGHLLVAPRRHAAHLRDLSRDEFQVLMDMLQRATTVLADTLQPEGMNVGMNVGAAAGAGVADHAHWHIVPRWVGDTSFMPLFAEVRVIPEHLEATYDRLKPVFDAAVAG